MKPHDAPVIIIGGATATGKSKIALELAKRIDGEIISADSMQVYRYMNIGTAKPSCSELASVKHHMIDILNPNEDFSVALFQKMCKECVRSVTDKGKTPILAGGTGFYLNSVIYGNEFIETSVDFAYRENLYECAREKGRGHLHGILAKIDPESAKAIHQNNVKRVIRAIEFFNRTGKKISEHNAVEKERKPALSFLFFVTSMERETLYKKINDRVDEMISNGLLEEVRGLLSMGYGEGLVSMQGIGYKELAEHINHDIPLESAIEQIKRNTRRYAKRQITWFKNQTDAHWVDTEKYGTPEIVNKIISSMKESFNG